MYFKYNTIMCGLLIGMKLKMTSSACIIELNKQEMYLPYVYGKKIIQHNLVIIDMVECESPEMVVAHYRSITNELLRRDATHDGYVAEIEVFEKDIKKYFDMYSMEIDSFIDFKPYDYIFGEWFRIERKPYLEEIEDFVCNKILENTYEYEEEAEI